jgi:DNA-binding SARP family transcriptional activator/Tfp pilus assembly protein PilF
MSEHILHLYLLGQTRAVCPGGDQGKDLRVQPKPLQLLAYLALNWKHPQRRPGLQALFWPDKPPRAAANNLRQALWHLRQALPAETLYVEGDVVTWNPAQPPWVDALAFETALQAGDLDAALDLYAGPLLPDAYDEWAQLERERLYLRYLTALEDRAHRHYKARNWETALADAERLLADDPLNEVATRLGLACYWALDQREAARRCYDAYRERAERELGASPLPETTDLYQCILRGEPHPDRHLPPEADDELADQAAHLALLETLGAFRQGLGQATAWAAEASGPALAAAQHWQGRFYLRMGEFEAARAALLAAHPLAATSDVQAAILADLATTETGLGNYPTAGEHYTQALGHAPLPAATRLRLLSSLGGLQGRMGHTAQARRTLEQAARLARQQDDPASLARAGGNLGILLSTQGEVAAARATLDEALQAARQADAHWLTAHIDGHLGLLAQDSGDLDAAAQHYQRAQALADVIGDRRGATLWTLNLGIVRYEQGRCAEALPLLTQGRAQASAQGSRSLQAGASIFIGSCLVAQGQENAGLASIQEGLALAQEIGDQERKLMGFLHQGRALAALGRSAGARAVLEQGLRQAEASGMHRLGEYLRAELQNLSSTS